MKQACHRCVRLISKGRNKLSNPLEFSKCTMGVQMEVMMIGMRCYATKSEQEKIISNILKASSMLPIHKTKVEEGQQTRGNLIEKLINAADPKELNTSLSLLCNNDDISEERLTAILHTSIIEQMDASSVKILMDFYARKGNTPKVKELFQYIKNPDEEMKTYLTQMLAVAGSALKSKSVHVSLPQRAMSKLVKTMPSNLQIANKRSISELKELEDTLKRKKDSLSYTHGVVIEAFAIRGNMDQAESYFSNIQHVNTDVINSMIDGWIRALNVDRTDMTKFKDDYQFTKKKVDYYFDLFDLYKVDKDARTFAYLLKFKFMELLMQTKDADVTPIIDLIERMIHKEKIKPDSYFVSTFIARLKFVQSKQKLLKLYNIYKKYLNRTSQTDSSNLALLSALTEFKCIPESLSLFEQFKTSLGSAYLSTAYNLMIKLFLHEDTEAAVLVFDEMMEKKIQRTETTYYHLISRFYELGDQKSVTKYFDLMTADHISPSEQILGFSITSLAATKNKNEVLQVLRQAKRDNKITANNCAEFIRAFGTIGKLGEAEKLFEEYKDTNNLKVYNEMLFSYVWLLCIEDAIALYLDFPMKGDIYTYETLVEALGIVREYDAVIEIHKIMIKLGITPTYRYYELLINILLKEKPTESVKSFLQTLPDEMSKNSQLQNVEQLIMKILF